MTQINKKTIIASMMAIMLYGYLGVTDAFAQDDLKWRSFEKAISVAEKTNRPVFIDVWAPWCGWCRKMKKEVYPKLASNLQANFITTRLNRDDGGATFQYKNRKLSSVKLTQQFNVQGVPAIVMLSPAGEYLLHLSGFIEAEKLEPVLDYISSGAYKTQSLSAFQNRTSKSGI